MKPNFEERIKSYCAIFELDYNRLSTEDIKNLTLIFTNIYNQGYLDGMKYVRNVIDTYSKGNKD